MSETMTEIFRVKGSFLMRTAVQKFNKEVIAVDEESAIEHVLSDIGSKHRTKRNNIKIEVIEKIPKEEASDKIIKKMVSA